MERRKFSQEFKLEAVKLVRERGVSVAQAARDCVQIFAVKKRGITVEGSLSRLNENQSRWIETATLVAALLAGLFFDQILQARAATVWIVAVGTLAIVLSKANYAREETTAVRLLQLVGTLSALYSFLHYPLMPVLPGIKAEAAFVLLWAGWLLASICGIACYRIPSLALIPPAFLVWSVTVARHVTGLPHGRMLDVEPLPEVAICLGLGLLISRIYALVTRRSVPPEFLTIIPVFAICIHLANYLWSAVAKAALEGPLLSWITFNNPIYIYLAALHNNYVTFSHLPAASWLGSAIDETYFVSNIIVFGAQALAIAGFFLPRRWLVILLLVFDGMHVSIALAAGANFWPWVLLNVAVAVVVVSPYYRPPGWKIALLASLFVVGAPLFANVAYLGWYDSGANNRLYILAEDRLGRRHYVSPNFFTAYSYPIAHTNYGVPEPHTAFATGMNGGAGDYRLAKAGRDCNVAELIRPGAHRAPPPELGRFIVAYHFMSRDIEERFGELPYNLYPHHFYVRPALMNDFERLEKSDIVAYIYARESACLSWRNGRPERRVISTGEHRIELPHG